MNFQIHCNYVNVPPIKPELIGHFSVKEEEDGKISYDPGLTMLKYYKRPSRFHRLSFDLNLAYDQTRRRTKVYNDKHVLYKWILQNFDEVYTRDSGGQWLRPNIICYRGLFTKLFCTLYERTEGWIICAVKFDNVIYLMDYDTETAKQRKAMETDMDKRRQTWGFKFEQFLLSDSPMEDPKPEEPLDESEEFCCMFKSQFGNNTVIYGAEMDGVISEEKIKDGLKGKNIEFVELKTNRFLNTQWKVDSFYKYKSLKWWSQSYLVGIKTIVCGLRDEDGIVEDIKEFSLDEIAHNSRDIWSGRKCRDFCGTFLEHIKKTVNKDFDKCLYKFSWDPKKHRRSIVVDEMDPHCEMAFLPEWYIKEILVLKNRDL